MQLQSTWGNGEHDAYPIWREDEAWWLAKSRTTARGSSEVDYEEALGAQRSTTHRQPCQDIIRS